MHRFFYLSCSDNKYHSTLISEDYLEKSKTMSTDRGLYKIYKDNKTNSATIVLWTRIWPVFIFYKSHEVYHVRPNSIQLGIYNSICLLISVLFFYLHKNIFVIPVSTSFLMFTFTVFQFFVIILSC